LFPQWFSAKPFATRPMASSKLNLCTDIYRYLIMSMCLQYLMIHDK
jgi:hypothetical protein